MSILPKSEFAPSPCGDLNLSVEASALPINIITEGKIQTSKLEIAKIRKEDIGKILEKAEIKKVKDCLVLSIDKGGAVFAQAFGKKYVTFNIAPLGQVSE